MYCNAPIIGQIKPLLDPNRLVLSFLGSLRFHFTTLPALSDKLLDGELETPNGDMIQVRTVWIIENEDDVPRFVTAYPAE